MMRQLQQHRVRNGSNSELQRGSIFDQPGYVSSDGVVNFGNFNRLSIRTVDAKLPPPRRFLHVDKAIAKRARHLVVHLRDHELSAARRR